MIDSDKETYTSNNNYYDSDKIKCDNILKEAREYCQNCQFFKAIPMLKEILAISQNNLLVLSELCSCLFEQNRCKEATEIANKGLKLAQSYSNSFYISKFYFYLGKGYKESGNYNNAITYYKLSLIKDFSNSNTYYSLAECYLKIQNYEEILKICEYIYPFCSEKEFEEIGFLRLKELALKQNQKLHSEQAHIFLGDEFSSKNQDKLALIEYETANKIAPENILILEKLFTCQIKLGLYKDAIETALKIISKDIFTIRKYYKGHGEYIMLSKIYSDLNSIYKSSWHFFKAQDAASMYEYYQAILRGLYENVFNKDKSISILKAAYESKPNRHEALEKLIVYLMLNKDYKTAIKYDYIGLDLAKSENNTNIILIYYEMLAEAFHEIKEYDKELDCYKSELPLIQGNQKKLNIFRLMINCYKAQEKYDQVSVYLEKSKQLINEGAEDCLDLQSMLIEQKVRLDKSSDYNKSIEHLNNGLKLCKNNNYLEALSELKKSYYLNSQNLDLLEAYSKCLKEAGYDQEASIIAKEGYEISKRDGIQEYLKRFSY